MTTTFFSFLPPFFGYRRGQLIRAGLATCEVKIKGYRSVLVGKEQ